MQRRLFDKWNRLRKISHFTIYDYAHTSVRAHSRTSYVRAMLNGTKRNYFHCGNISFSDKWKTIDVWMCVRACVSAFVICPFCANGILHDFSRSHHLHLSITRFSLSLSLSISHSCFPPHQSNINIHWAFLFSSSAPHSLYIFLYVPIHT